MSIMPPLRSILVAAFAGVAVAGVQSTQAAEPFSLTIEGHRFTPDTLTVPAGEKFKIEVLNRDDVPEEFESYDLKVEKIVVGGGRIIVFAGPLKPGQYNFVGDYHPETAKGTITAVTSAAQ